MTDYPVRCYRCLRVLRRAAMRFHLIGTYPVLICKERGACSAALRDLY
jgi:hypothetical protein